MDVPEKWASIPARCGVPMPVHIVAAGNYGLKSLEPSYFFFCHSFPGRYCAEKKISCCNGLHIMLPNSLNLTCQFFARKNGASYQCNEAYTVSLILS